MLNVINQEKIETVFRAFTGKANTEEKFNLTPTLNQWAENKRDIFEFFGDKLTIEREFSGTLSDENINNSFEYFKDRNDYVNYDTREFMDDITAEELKNNKCIKDRDSDYYPNYKVGQKLSKYLNNIIDNDRPNYAEINDKPKSLKEYFSIKFSMFLQSMSFDGILVVSIDPLDYLTMSLNQANWNSCHDQNGCHKGGIISYMTDSCSIVTYVKSKNDVEYDVNYIQFSHNSKKWRQMAYLDINTLSAIFSRQYPSDNENSAKVSREIIANQFSKFLGIEAKYTITRNGRRIREMVKDCGDQALHYNDILNMDREYVRLKMSEGGENPHITIGNMPLCPMCGEKHLDNKRELLCKKCRGEFRICKDCGEIMYLNEGREIHRHDDEFYCESCFSKSFVRCVTCGNFERINNVQILNGEFVCEGCLNRYCTVCSDCGIHVRDSLIIRHQNHNYCVTCYDRIAIEEEMSA